MNPNYPYLVLAGDKKQFDFWLKGKNKKAKNYIYASSLESVLGRQYKEILFWGEWWKSDILKTTSLSKLKTLLHINNKGLK